MNGKLGTRQGRPVWVYKLSEIIPDKCPKKSGMGSDDQGNARLVVQELNGRRRFISYTNIEPYMNILDFEINLPKLYWTDVETVSKINKAAVEQGIFTESEVNYF